jgi:hypothetical protein
MQEITTVDITLSMSYVVKYIVYHNHDWFLSKGYTEEYLESNRIFAICFDTTPLESIANMADYREILEKYPDSNRVFDTSNYIGYYEEKDWEEIIDTWLSSLSSSYEIVEREHGYTRSNH